MEATDHLRASLVAAIALANAFGSGERQGRPAVAPDSEAVAAVLKLTTNQPAPTSPADYEAGAVVLYDALGALPDVDRAADLINGLLRSTQAAPQLTRSPNWHLHFGNPSEAQGWLAEFATAVATLLGSDELQLVRRCAADRCDDLFLDVTRNHTQRFCSPNCQNRTKVAAHRARSNHGSL